MHKALDELLDAGYISAIDKQFGESLLALRPPEEGTSPLLALAGAMASLSLRLGHICLQLNEAEKLLDSVDLAERKPLSFQWPDAALWEEALRKSHLVSDGKTREALVLEDGRLYLYRYYDYQRRLSEALLLRSKERLPVDQAKLEESLDELFSEYPKNWPARQAAGLSTQKALTLISGGPGTGKTTVAFKILAALRAQNPKLRIRLLAPTGKAAARLTESIRTQAQQLTSGQFQLDEAATTLHRGLGFQPQNPSRFLYHAGEPLPADIVILDEASMVDLAMMCKLMEAVPLKTRLVLLGDKDQLASVAAGHVLGDIAKLGEEGGPLLDNMLQLTHNHRFGKDSGIASIASATRTGDDERLIELLKSELPDINWVPKESPEESHEALKAFAEAGYAPHFQAHENVKEALKALSTFQILTAHRRGPYGAETLNHLIPHWLGLPQDQKTSFVEGSPLMILENDYKLGLFNGDSGILFRGNDGQLRAHFKVSGRSHDPRESKSFMISELPHFQLLFAMTVHKAQGSGYDHVLCILPNESSPIVTRELLYTAITRARKKVTLIASESILREAVKSQVKRNSGLEEAFLKAMKARASV